MRNTIVRLLATALLLLLGSFNAAALTINVVGSDGLQVSDFRWLVEEDTMKPSIPGRPADGTNLSLNFHTSYAPVVAAGASPNNTIALSSTKRYHVSVLPRSGYQLGGAPVEPGQQSVTVWVNKLPIPTAQISVFVFEDNQPINGVANLPQEVGLGGFSVILSEAGGVYGQSGGQVTKDAFGNPLGTTYKRLANGQFQMGADGSPVVDVLGNGALVSGPDGVVVIKNLYPAKYTITVNPPPGSDWHQTSTIEGTKGIDAWVKANEPPFFTEFGPPGHHVDIGFVRTVRNPAVLNGSTTVTGKVVNIHNSRPPDFTFYNGAPFPSCWIGLNELAVAVGRAVFTAPCNADSTFSIPNVPAGTYQLVIWDEPLDMIIASSNITVPANVAQYDLQEVPVFNWFARHESYVFFDANQNGFPDPGEAPIPGQNINLRFRDGSIYQSYATNPQGVAVFNEFFPFFNWMITEVDFARFKATGSTTIVDGGGAVPPHGGWAMPSYNRLTPQPQFCMQVDEDAGIPECIGKVGQPRIGPAGNNLSHTETGPVLLQAQQAFLGTTNVIHWGKANYAPGENGGITGIVHYATTRAEDEPRYAAAENWEPGIPRVQVNLYRDCNGDGIPDVPDRTPGATGCLALNASLADVKRSDVDNWPFGWADGTAPKGPEDVKRNGDPNSPVFSSGDAVAITTTDSWDDNIPRGCQGDVFVSNGYRTDCYDGLRNFNQVRPGVFDGGYAFGSPLGDPDLPPGHYIVEAVTPPGYLHQGNGDKNVDFGDSITPSPLVLPPACVGEVAPVPEYLNLFPGEVPNPVYAPGKTWSKCDMKAVDVAQSKNVAADFYMFTEVPVAAHITGFILDDLANEFDPNAPTFGEKYAPPWIPVSIQDWSGKELSRIYSDQWGTYNALVPSSYTINPPFPSGVMPNMLTTCINSPGPIRDTRAGSPTFGQMIIDPYFQRQYSQFCYTFQYMPGKTTYLDTPVLPIAAFAGPDQFPLDCEFPDGTPIIFSVDGRTFNNVSQNGPWVPSVDDPSRQPRLAIVSVGTRDVPNPAFGSPGEPETIARDFGFGNGTASFFTTLSGGNVGQGATSIQVVSAVGSPAVPFIIRVDDEMMRVTAKGGTNNRTWTVDRGIEGTPARSHAGPSGTNLGAAVASIAPVARVTMGTAGNGIDLNSLPLPIVSWSNDIVVASVPAGVGSGQLMVTRENGVTSIMGVTVTVGGGQPKRVVPGGSIQAAIDSAADGDLILVPPGSYNELVIMNKKVRLQGWGAPATIINAMKSPAEKLHLWRQKIGQLYTAGTWDLLPGQTLTFDAPNNEPSVFNTEEGPGIIVVAKDTGPFRFTQNNNARIDGFTITGGDLGGGIFASGYTRYLEVSNNKVVGNYGVYGGGIRIGHPMLTGGTDGALYGGYTNSRNDNVYVHHNHVAQNGTSDAAAAGGGIAMCSGADNYRVTQNYVCGNFSQGNGGGIGHIGISRDGTIAQNTVIFNQSFAQGQSVSGGGIFVGGQASLTPGGLSPGSGSVSILANLVQGNQAGAGDGGGIATNAVNGLDVSSAPNNPTNSANPWYTLTVQNNMIVNNVAGLAGGGIALQDTIRPAITNNTIANNDSTATAGLAFAPGNPNQSTPQPAGIVSRAHSVGLYAAIGNGTPYKAEFADPEAFINNIVWHNRSFYFTVNPNTGGYQLLPNVGAGQAPVYSDLAVLGTSRQGTFPQFTGAGVDRMSPGYSILTNTTGYAASNFTADPVFIAEYVNGNRGQTIQMPEVTTTITAVIAFDEGGNSIDVHFGPITLRKRPCPANGSCLYGDYHVRPASPALNAGNQTARVPATDFDGQSRPRPAGSNPDIGADERAAAGGN